MTTKSSLHADHQLDQLAGQFEHWRQTRAHPGERIPHHLWEQAAVLAQVVPYSRVAQHVRVSPSDLKKPMTARPDWPPPSADVRVPLSARELLILLWNGHPDRAQMAQDWRRVA